MKPLTVLFALPLLALQPAAAQEADYTTDDEVAMQSCIEAVRDVNADPEAADLASESDCIGAASGLCLDGPDAGSTIVIVECLGRETAWWDGLLNDRYQELRERLEPQVFQSLHDAQTAWIAWRDAKCAFEYEYWADGTIRGIYYGSCMLDVTAARTIELGTVFDWLEL